MSKKFYYPFHYADFDSDTSDWDIAEVGIYIRLLNHQWKHGYIPSDIERLMRITRVFDREVFESCWETVYARFKEDEDGNLRNGRMERERAHVENISQARANAGRKGGKKSGVSRRSSRDTESDAPAKDTPKPSETPIPDDFAMNDSMEQWGTKDKGQSREFLIKKTESFVAYQQKHNIVCANWEAAWRLWIIKGIEMELASQAAAAAAEQQSKNRSGRKKGQGGATSAVTVFDERYDYGEGSFEVQGPESFFEEPSRAN